MLRFYHPSACLLFKVDGVNGAIVITFWMIALLTCDQIEFACEGVTGDVDTRSIRATHAVMG
jgi:hypothetical protein